MDEKTMIAVIDARLHYLFADCPPDRVNFEEVNALVNLLKEYDPCAAGGCDVHISEGCCVTPEVVTGMMAVVTCITVLILLSREN